MKRLLGSHSGRSKIGMRRNNDAAPIHNEGVAQTRKEMMLSDVC